MIIAGTVLAYKIVNFAVGLCMAYFGYKLLTAGIFEGGGDIDTQFLNNKLIIKKASPGVFFALFGSSIIGIAAYKGLTIENFERSFENCSMIPITKNNRKALFVLDDMFFNEKTVHEIDDDDDLNIAQKFLHSLDNYTDLCEEELLASSKIAKGGRGIASQKY